MHIIFDSVEPEERALLETALTGHSLTFLDSKLEKGAPEVLASADIVSIFVSSRIDAALLDSMPILRGITARSMGFDHIAVARAQERGIPVSYVPSYGVRTVAEFAFSLILSLSRKSYAAYDRLRTEGTAHAKDFEGFDLAGKSIGIVGTGKIGKSAARIARGFDMQVLLTDAYPDAAFATEIGASYRPLEELVAASDIISIHVPYLPTTHHLFNERIFNLTKKGAYLINTARGGIVDTRALLSALQSGQLAGAGLDVIEGERALFDEMSLLSSTHTDIEEYRELVAAHTLLDMPNVILTPHIAFNSREAKNEIIDTTIANIRAIVDSNPINLVKV